MSLVGEPLWVKLFTGAVFLAFLYAIGRLILLWRRD